MTTTIARPAIRRSPAPRQAPTSAPPAPIAETVPGAVQVAAGTTPEQPARVAPVFDSADAAIRRAAGIPEPTPAPAAAPMSADSAQPARAGWKPVAQRYADTLDAALRVIPRIKELWNAGEYVDANGIPLHQALASTMTVLSYAVAELRCAPSGWTPTPVAPPVVSVGVVVELRREHVAKYAASFDDPSDLDALCVTRITDKMARVRTVSGIELVLPVSALKVSR